MRKLNTKVCCHCKVEKPRTAKHFYLQVNTLVNKETGQRKTRFVTSSSCKECSKLYNSGKQFKEMVKKHREKYQTLPIDSEVSRIMYTSEDEIMQQIDVFERIKMITYEQLSEQEKEIYNNLI